MKAELERLLATQNLTDNEKSALEQKKIDIENALTKIADVAKKIADLKAKTDGITISIVKSSDKTNVDSALSTINDLLNNNKGNLTDNEKATLGQKKTDAENTLAKIAEVAKKITDVNSKINGITTDNVKSSDKTNLDNALTTITDLLATNNLTNSEKAALEQKKTDAGNALAKIAEVAKAITDAKDPVKDITKDNVTKDDGTNLKKLAEDLQNILEDFASNLTDTEKAKIEDQIKSTQDILEELDEIKAVEDLIKSLPNPGDVKKNDANDVKKAEDDFNKLTDHQKDLTDPDMVTKLKDVTNALKELLLFDIPTSTKVEGVDGTEFDIRTELVVTPIKDTLDKTTLNKFAIGVTNATNDQEITQLYDVKLLLNGQPIQPDGKVKITFKLTDEQQNYKDLQVVYIADDGTVTIIPCEINGNEVSFITDHFSYYGIIGTPVKSNSGDKTTPNTGDNMPVIPYIILNFLSAATLVITTRKRKFKVIKK